MRIPTTIPVIFHNLTSYDGHIILRPLAKLIEGLENINVIPNTIEKFTSIITPKFKFIDSYRHLSSSLDDLVDSLKKRGLDSFSHLKEEFPDELIPYLVKKGLYPYSYVDSFEKFNEHIPGIQFFTNDLTGKAASQEDYNNLMFICQKLELTTIGDLHDHYVKLDTLLLADVIAHYRKLGLKEYRLDPLHYSTAPAFSYDAMLKMTKAEPELIHDINMYLFLESGIRGGISTIPHRHANDTPTSKLFYTDCCNLYGWSMSQKLPYANFKWLKDDEIKLLDVKNFDGDGDIGLILEVDLKYPTTLHDDHKDYPVAPENLLITKDMLSPHAKECQEKLKNGGFTSAKRLTPNLYDKERYIVHIKNLQLYLSLGLELGTIHSVLSFTQKAWLEPYILFNTEKRKAAMSSFEKDFFKLLINSIFGKMMENVRKYRQIRLINCGRQHRLYTSKPQFKGFQIISEDLVAAEMERIETKLNKAIYAGFSILELSKTKMYDFHYNVMKKKYPEATMCFTDTDSLLYKIPTEDLSKEIYNLRHHLDLSNYPEDHPLFDESHKSTPGFFKDECKGVTMEEFVGLRAKCYSIKLEGDERKLATAGLRKSTHSTLTHERFLQTLIYKAPVMAKQKTIVSKAHTLFTVETERIGLNPLDIKRFVLEDGVNTLPYGHYSLRS